MELRITSYCRIKNKEIVLNGIPQFKAQEKKFAEFSKEAYQHINLNYPKFFKMDNLSKLAMLNSELLLQDAKLLEKYKPDEIAVFICNSTSSLDTDRKYTQSIQDKYNYFPSPSIFVYTLPNILVGEICIRNNFKGENSFFVFEKFEAEFAESQVVQLFVSERCKACIMGWIDFEYEQDDALLCLIEKSDNLNFTELSAMNYAKLYS
jgi:hypothetical protein